LSTDRSPQLRGGREQGSYQLDRTKPLSFLSNSHPVSVFLGALFGRLSSPHSVLSRAPASGSFFAPSQGWRSLERSAKPPLQFRAPLQNTDRTPRVSSFQEQAGSPQRDCGLPACAVGRAPENSPSRFLFLKYGKQGKAYFPTENYEDKKGGETEVWVNIL
jgi:hypothetical protein